MTLSVSELIAIALGVYALGYSIGVAMAWVRKIQQVA